MSKKKLIAKILSKLSEEELEDLLNDDEDDIDEVEEEVEDTEEEGSGHKFVINKNKRGSRHNKRAGKSSGQTKKKKKKRGRRGNQKGKPCRVLPFEVRERENQFDNFIQKTELTEAEQKEMEEAKKTDEEASKKGTIKVPRGSSLIEVECCVCGEEEEVSASIVGNVNRYKCNECSCSAGW